MTFLEKVKLETKWISGWLGLGEGGGEMDGKQGGENIWGQGKCPKIGLRPFVIYQNTSIYASTMNKFCVPKLYFHKA